ncbi:hypothetical protein RN001_014350 [Aquatica leii]|uniref:Uncharacterized protein n=1 Tax=Aquatica leii TaxID=1421715 RepID=A0AAN7NZE8_9COLE|nr:hypothetical protein RN001_014350 [Aquatica leii]
MFRHYFYFISVISLLPSHECCRSFHKIHTEITPKHGAVFNKTIRGCVSTKSVNVTDITGVKIANQPVTQLKIGAVENMESLIHIEFIKCNIETVQPRAFRDVPSLERIFLHNGLLEKIPKGVFVNMPSLKKISFSHNKISNIENASFQIPTLQILHLSYNKLKDWNKYWFGSFQNLIEIDIRDNLLGTIPSNAFENFENVSKIVLDSNMITSIEMNAFAGLHKLKHLGLTYNLLTEININWFPNSINLSKLTVNANKLNYVSLKVLERVKPKQILIDGNPWKCECWKDLVVWMHDNGGKIVTTDYCKNENVPVCITVENSKKCDENVDYDLIRKYFDGVKKSVKDINSVKKMKCYRLD